MAKHKADPEVLQQVPGQGHASVMLVWQLHPLGNRVWGTAQFLPPLSLRRAK